MGSSTPRGRASLAFSRLRVVAFRTVRRRRLPETPDFGAQYPACRYPCPTLQVQHCCCPRMARGQGGSLFLPCTTLSFATLCRFIPALSGPWGPPHGSEPVSTRYAQIRLTGPHFDSSPTPMSHTPTQFASARCRLFVREQPLPPPTRPKRSRGPTHLAGES